MDNNEQLIEAGTSFTLEMDRFYNQTPEAQAAEVLSDIISITNVSEEQTSESVEEEFNQVFDEDFPILVEESHVELTSEEEALLAAALESQNNEIPANSPTLLVEDVTSRFSGASWYDKIRTKIILLAGLGGIGSYVAFLLSRMHPFKIVMYDDDVVESANMSGQLYCMKNIGEYKVNAIYSTMKKFSNFYNVNALRERITDETPARDIMICGFDNMEARKTFYRVWKAHVRYSSNEDECLFIDGRLAAEEFQVFAIKGDDKRAMEIYEEEWLFDDSEAEETLCSYKQTTFMANMIGSVMVNLFVNFVANECDPVFPRDVPFLTTYDASTMYFKVEM